MLESAPKDIADGIVRDRERAVEDKMGQVPRYLF
jgi:hypothetical protein